MKNIPEKPNFSSYAMLMCRKEKSEVFVKEASWMCKYLDIGPQIDKKIKMIE